MFICVIFCDLAVFLYPYAHIEMMIAIFLCHLPVPHQVGDVK